jgi:hypothetical protein
MSLEFQAELCCEAVPEPECSICFESIGFTAKYITKCQHTFHTGCINKWCKTNNSCPLCRTSPLMEINLTKNADYIYNSNVLYNNYIINNIIIQNSSHGVDLDASANTTSYSTSIYNTSQENNISPRTYANINNYINQTINTINNSRNMNNNNINININNYNINNYIINNNMLIID